MRVPGIRRRLVPAVAGGALLAVGLGTAVSVLSGGQGAAGRAAAVAGPGLASTAMASTAMAGTASASTVPASTVPASTASAASVPASAVSAGSGLAGQGSPGAGLGGQASTHLVVPDVIAAVPGGVTPADLARVKRLAGVRAVLAIDGARITVNGVQLTVLAAPAAALRPWTPPATAASQGLWSAFQAGELVTTRQAATAAHLKPGGRYPVAAAVQTQIAEGGTALLGVAGVDGVVSQAEGQKLGLVRSIAVLVNAPAADMTSLAAQVQATLGRSARVVRLVAETAPTSLPVDTTVPAGRPANYLQLFQASAARYCPGLSWTVLAAIGQIESGDGQNVGPSTAGALGPMQFLPSTWAAWGITGFGDTGAPDIMNPFDAVPTAARMLCADGASSGAAGLRQAIFDYNHADWYVDEVLTLAAEYAREY